MVPRADEAGYYPHMSTYTNRQKMVNDAKSSLERMQKFDPSVLSREGELGNALNFKDAVPHARRLIELYTQLPIESVDWFNYGQASALKSCADSDYNRLAQILSFDPVKGHGAGERSSWTNELEQCYETTFQYLAPLIAYGVGRVTDFTKIGRDARATIQDIEDRAKRLGEDMAKHRKDAEFILEDIRKVAAEQGVSQQAIYFQTESTHHGTEADKWLGTTKKLTWTLFAYAVLALFLHKIPFMAPTNSYETVQLAVGKILVFTTIAYFLILSAKNYIAHRHNAVVNKHRQNALVTYRALVEAAGDETNRDIVLTKAAECIFGPQATGFSKSEGGEAGPISMVSLTPASLKSMSTSQ